MDLGSGFGRMGLLWGLLDERSEFDGYEFVPHRVHNAQAAAERAGIADRVRFIAQDLADPEFRIPRADVYYLYDPFTASTYQSVLNQIIAHARTAPTTVITKGGATRWFSAAIDGWAWSGPVSFDGANLALFQNWSA